VGRHAGIGWETVPKRLAADGRGWTPMNENGCVGVNSRTCLLGTGRFNLAPLGIYCYLQVDAQQPREKAAAVEGPSVAERGSGL